jgi:hypothetical protein
MAVLEACKHTAEGRKSGAWLAYGSQYIRHYARASPRGDVITHPGQYQPTRRIDARLRLLKDTSSSIKHGDEVKFFVGASETIATLRLLGTEELNLWQRRLGPT